MGKRKSQKRKKNVGGERDETSVSVTDVVTTGSASPEREGS